MASPNCFASTTAASQGGFSSNVSREKLKIKIYVVNLAVASKHRSDILFWTKMKRGKAFWLRVLSKNFKNVVSNLISGASSLAHLSPQGWFILHFEARA